MLLGGGHSLKIGDGADAWIHWLPFSTRPFDPLHRFPRMGLAPSPFAPGGYLYLKLDIIQKSGGAWSPVPVLRPCLIWHFDIIFILFKIFVNVSNLNFAVKISFNLSHGDRLIPLFFIIFKNFLVFSLNEKSPSFKLFQVAVRPSTPSPSWVSLGVFVLSCFVLYFPLCILLNFHMHAFCFVCLLCVIFVWFLSFDIFFITLMSYPSCRKWIKGCFLEI